MWKIKRGAFTKIAHITVAKCYNVPNLVLINAKQII